MGEWRTPGEFPETDCASEGELRIQRSPGAVSDSQDCRMLTKRHVPSNRDRFSNPHEIPRRYPLSLDEEKAYF